MNSFISFEGIDGCGKSTQIKILSDKLSLNNIENIVIREPGDTGVSDKIRNILLDKNNKIGEISETLLFLSARAQLVKEKIIPFSNNNVVICDRFIDSTVAYQGYGRNQDIETINTLNNFATGNINPDITFILEINSKEAFKRLNPASLDRMELSGIEFLEKVSKGYKEIALSNPSRCKVIDCNNKDIMMIHSEIITILNLFYGRDLI